MPSTTFHIPDDILREIDRLAEKRNISRNKLVIEACKAELARDAGEWPERFFFPRVSREEQNLLREATAEMENAVYEHRRNRGTPLL